MLSSALLLAAGLGSIWSRRLLPKIIRCHKGRTLNYAKSLHAASDVTVDASNFPHIAGDLDILLALNMGEIDRVHAREIKEKKSRLALLRVGLTTIALPLVTNSGLVLKFKVDMHLFRMVLTATKTLSRALIPRLVVSPVVMEFMSLV
jgi:hypothetical protein